MPDVWELREGWEPLPVIGSDPLPDVEFRKRAAIFAQAEGCSVEDVLANGPYQLRGKPSLSAGEQYALGRRGGAPDALKVDEVTNA